MHTPILKYTLAYVIFVGVCSIALYGFSYRENLNQLSQTGDIRLEQAQDRLLGQLASFQKLPNYLAKHPQIKSALNETHSMQVVNEFLLDTALTSGAENILVLNTSGHVIASSDFRGSASLLGNNLYTRPDIRAALNGRLGFYHALNAGDLSRNLYFARGIISSQGNYTGVVVVKVDIAALEFEWRVDEDVITFQDSEGIIFISNRQSLTLLRNETVNAFTPSEQKYANTNFLPIKEYKERKLFGHKIWMFQDTKILPKIALVTSRFVPHIEMTSYVFQSTLNAHSTALLEALLVATVLTLIGLGLWILHQRRQQLIELLEIEAAVNTKLEARVESRTQELRKTQNQLVQAGKLTALGQMSAGISHELNQPLAAIQNFAESGEKLIDRGRNDDASSNFKSITMQIDRMSRILRSLRAFARKEKETIEPVDLQKVVNESINLSQTRCQREAVEIIKDGSDHPVWVMGGHVRLQQVVINMITNAIDAMDGSTDKSITLTLAKQGKMASLKIRDQGTGLTDPTRVFEPFYSTKHMGSSNGMGLGLSISYGIIGTFGGDIECRNHPLGGAEFTIFLRHADVDQKQ